MPAKLHPVRLSAAERAELEKVSACNRKSEREKKRARILLLCDVNVPRDEGGRLTDGQVAACLNCHEQTVLNVRRRATQRGAVEVVKREEQLQRKARRLDGEALDGEAEAHLVALTCSAPPEGASRWTLKLLRERLIHLDVVESIGCETIRTTLKKTRLNRG